MVNLRVLKGRKNEQTISEKSEGGPSVDKTELRLEFPLGVAFIIKAVKDELGEPTLKASFETQERVVSAVEHVVVDGTRGSAVT